jgi:hypothetical protein
MNNPLVGRICMIARGGSPLLSFEELRDFITSRMRLSHIYQPLLIKTLVESGGVATVRQLAGSFLAHDESQIQYYENTLKKMPIKVLTNHRILKRDGELVTLEVKKLTLEQKAEIKKLCEQRMQEYVAALGLSIWTSGCLMLNLDSNTRCSRRPRKMYSAEQQRKTVGHRSHNPAFRWKNSLHENAGPVLQMQRTRETRTIPTLEDS